MSIQLLQSNTPQVYAQSIKVHDILIRNNLTCSNGAAVFKNLGVPVAGSISCPGEMSFGTMPSTPYAQATRSTAVDTQNEYSFMINAATESIAAHTSVVFNVNNTHVNANSHILITPQTEAAGIVYSVAECGSNFFKVQATNTTAGALTTGSRLGVRLFAASTLA